MKKLISAVFAFILGVLPISTGAKLFVPSSQDATPVAAEPDHGSQLKTVEELTPVSIVIKRGDNLTRYAERYNLASYKEIVEFNKGKAGAKCIKSANLILRGCEISIPVYTKTVVEVQQEFNEEVFEKATDTARLEGEEKYLFGVQLLSGLILVLVASIIFVIWSHDHAIKRMQKVENEKVDLSGKLWAAEDKVKNLEADKDDFGKSLTHVRLELTNAKQQLDLKTNELADCDKDFQELLSKHNALATKTSFLPGNYVELQSRENGKIKAKIIKLKLDANGEIEVYVGCPVSEECVVNKEESLKFDNALSHIFKVHGASQDTKPNSRTE